MFSKRNRNISESLGELEKAAYGSCSQSISRSCKLQLMFLQLDTRYVFSITIAHLGAQRCKHFGVSIGMFRLCSATFKQINFGVWCNVLRFYQPRARFAFLTNSCVSPNCRYSFKRYAKIYWAQYEKGMLVYIPGIHSTPIWRPEHSVNICNRTYFGYQEEWLSIVNKQHLALT